MKTVKGKVLTSVEPNTKYMGCTFYLEGEQALDGCVFDNCSFRESLYYVEDSPHCDSLAKFNCCSFPQETTVEIESIAIAFLWNGSPNAEAMFAASTVIIVGNEIDFAKQGSPFNASVHGMNVFKNIHHLNLEGMTTLQDIDHKIYRIPTLRKITLPKNDYFNKDRNRLFMEWEENGEHYLRGVTEDSRTIQLGKVEKLS